MPSVYDYHHIELNNVGRGKKRISLTSADGGIKGVLQTPQKERNGVNGRHSVDGSNGHNSVDSSPNGSRPASRRGSRSEDTKTKLFGPPTSDTPRKVKDLFKSTVFANTEITTKVTPQKVSPPRAIYTPVRRNPITGEVLGTPTNGTPKKLSLPIQSSCGNGIKQNGNGSICSLSSISSIPSN